MTMKLNVFKILSKNKICVWKGYYFIIYRAYQLNKIPIQGV